MNFLQSNRFRYSMTLLAGIVPPIAIVFTSNIVLIIILSRLNLQFSDPILPPYFVLIAFAGSQILLISRFRVGEASFQRFKNSLGWLNLIGPIKVAALSFAASLFCVGALSPVWGSKVFIVVDPPATIQTAYADEITALIVEKSQFFADRGVDEEDVTLLPSDIEDKLFKRCAFREVKTACKQLTRKLLSLTKLETTLSDQLAPEIGQRAGDTALIISANAYPADKISGLWPFDTNRVRSEWLSIDPSEMNTDERTRIKSWAAWHDPVFYSRFAFDLELAVDRSEPPNIVVYTGNDSTQSCESLTSSLEESSSTYSRIGTLEKILPGQEKLSGYMKISETSSQLKYTITAFDPPVGDGGRHISYVFALPIDRSDYLCLDFEWDPTTESDSSSETTGFSSPINIWKRSLSVKTNLSSPSDDARTQSLYFGASEPRLPLADPPDVLVVNTASKCVDSAQGRPGGSSPACVVVSFDDASLFQNGDFALPEKDAAFLTQPNADGWLSGVALDVAAGIGSTCASFDNVRYRSYVRLSYLSGECISVILYVERSTGIVYVHLPLNEQLQNIRSTNVKFWRFIVRVSVTLAFREWASKQMGEAVPPAESGERAPIVNPGGAYGWGPRPETFLEELILAATGKLEPRPAFSATNVVRQEFFAIAFFLLSAPFIVQYLVFSLRHMLKERAKS